MYSNTKPFYMLDVHFCCNNSVFFSPVLSSNSTFAVIETGVGSGCHLDRSCPLFFLLALETSPHMGRAPGWRGPNKPTRTPSWQSDHCAVEHGSLFPPAWGRASEGSEGSLCVFRCQWLLQNSGPFLLASVWKIRAASPSQSPDPTSHWHNRLRLLFNACFHVCRTDGGDCDKNNSGGEV